MKKGFAFILILLCASMVFSQKKEEIIQRVIALETENVQNKAAIDALNQTIQNIKDENALLKEQIKLQNDINQLQNSTIADLNTKLEALQKQNEALTAQLEELKRTVQSATPSIITDPTNEEDSIVSVLQQYYGAKKWEERVRFVYKGEQMSLLMQEYYKDEFERLAISPNVVAIPGNNYKIGDIFLESSTGTYIRKTEKGFQIDWEATVGYNKTACGSYATAEGTNKIQIRAIVSNPVSATFADFGVGESYYQLHIETKDGYNGPAYVFKTSSTGQQISKLLKDGKKHRLILDVYGKHKYDDWENEKYLLFLDKVVQEGWAK